MIKKMAELCKLRLLFYGSFRFCVLAFRPLYPLTICLAALLREG
jgi:hypothetical protein